MFQGQLDKLFNDSRQARREATYRGENAWISCADSPTLLASFLMFFLRLGFGRLADFACCLGIVQRLWNGSSSLPSSSMQDFLESSLKLNLENKIRIGFLLLYIPLLHCDKMA